MKNYQIILQYKTIKIMKRVIPLRNCQSVESMRPWDSIILLPSFILDVILYTSGLALLVYKRNDELSILGGENT